MGSRWKYFVFLWWCKTAAPRVAVARSSLRRCHFFQHFIIFRVTLAIVSQSLQLVKHCIMYSPEEILNFGLEGLIPPPPPNIPVELLRTSVSAWIASQTKRWHRRRWKRKQKWGKIAGIQARLKNFQNKLLLPSLFVANTQSILNKIDQLRLRISSQKWNSCVLFFLETCLNANIPDLAIKLIGRTVYRADWTADSGKHKGGGMCIYVSNSWCTSVDITEQHCTPDLEFIMLKANLSSYQRSSPPCFLQLFTFPLKLILS